MTVIRKRIIADTKPREKSGGEMRWHEIKLDAKSNHYELFKFRL